MLRTIRPRGTSERRYPFGAPAPLRPARQPAHANDSRLLRYNGSGQTSTKYRRSKDIEKQFLKSRPAHHPRSICDQHYGAYRMACGLPADDGDDDDAHDDDAADAGDGSAGGGRGGSGAAASAGSSAVEAPTRSKRRQRSESESLRDLAYQTAQEHGVNPQDMLRVLQTAEGPEDGATSRLPPGSVNPDYSKAVDVYGRSASAAASSQASNEPGLRAVPRLRSLTGGVVDDGFGELANSPAFRNLRSLSDPMHYSAAMPLAYVTAALNAFSNYKCKCPPGQGCIVPLVDHGDPIMLQICCLKCAAAGETSVAPLRLPLTHDRKTIAKQYAAAGMTHEEAKDFHLKTCQGFL